MRLCKNFIRYKEYETNMYMFTVKHNVNRYLFNILINVKYFYLNFQNASFAQLFLFVKFWLRTVKVKVVLFAWFQCLDCYLIKSQTNCATQNCFEIWKIKSCKQNHFKTVMNKYYMAIKYSIFNICI